MSSAFHLEMLPADVMGRAQRRRQLTRQRRWAWARRRATQVLALSLAALAFGVLLTSGRPGPKVTDEIGYLLNAQALAGQRVGDLSCCTVYSGGWSLLVAPFAAVIHSPQALYHAVLLINAFLGAALVPLLYALVRRAFNAPHGAAMAAAACGATTPGVVLLGRYAWTEEFLAVLVVGWLLLWARVTDWDQPGARRARALLAASAVAGFLPSVHARALWVLVLHSLACLLLLARRRSRAATILASLGATCVVFAAGRMLNAQLASVVAPHSTGNPFLGNAVRSFASAEGILDAVGSVSGQLWYLGVSTGGLALVGWLAAFRARRTLGGSAWIGVLLSTAVVAQAGVSALAFGELGDSSYWVYGRYIEYLGPLCVAVAIALLWRPGVRAPRWALGGLAAIWIAMLGVRYVAGDALLGAYHNPLNVVGLPGLTGQTTYLAIFRSSVAASVVILALLVARAVLPRGRAILAPVVLLFFVATSTFFVRGWQHDADRQMYPGGQTLQQVPALIAARHIEIPRTDIGVVGPYSMATYFLPQAQVHLTPVDSMPGEDADTVLAGDDRQPTGWRKLGRTPDGIFVIWVRPSGPSDL